MLRVDGVTIRFGGNVALDTVSFSLRPGQLTAVIGPNGAGKTTLLDVISGLVSADTGRVLYGEIDITSTPPWTRAARWIGRTFQQVKAVDTLTALENILLHSRDQKGISLADAVLWRRRWLDEELLARQRAQGLLSRCGIGSLTSSKAAVLSFGQRRLVSICGSLMDDRPVLLLDEPFAGLDPQAGNRAADCLLAAVSAGACVLIVEHNLERVAEVAGRVIALDRGSIVADGTPDAVLCGPVFARAYIH